MKKIFKIIIVNFAVLFSFCIILFLISSSVFHFYEQKFQIQSLIPFKVLDKWIPYVPEHLFIKGITKYTTRFSLGEDYKSKHINEDKSVEYNISHKLSSIGSRIDLNQNINASKHLLLVGDSQTFGVGVEDSEVYSNVLSKRLINSDYRVYNLGFRGWGAATNYLLFDKKLFDIRKYVKETQGTLVYLFTPELTERDTGTASVFGYLYGSLPYYYKNRGEYVVDGMFENSFSSAFDRLLASMSYSDRYDLLRRKYLPKFMNKVNWERMYEKSAELFVQMERDYLERFPGSKFLILICDYRFKDDKRINKILDRHKLKYFDYRNESNCLGDRYFFFSENHLNKNGHLNIAKKVEEYVLSMDEE